MQSSFERRAANERVDAVEQRWLRQDENRRRAERRTTLRRYATYATIALVGLTIAVGAWIGTGHKVLYGILDETLGGFFRSRGLSRSERVRLDDFSVAIRQFDVSEYLRWKDAPRTMRPKNAPSGFKYRMLVEKKGGACGLYEMTADGKGHLSVVEQTPFGVEKESSLAEFNRSKVGAVYLISCEGKVYVAGADDPKAGRALLRRICAHAH